MYLVWLRWLLGRVYGARVKMALGTVALMVLLVGCGDGGTSSTSASHAAAPVIGLKSLCPKVEAVLPNSPVPRRQALVDLQGKLGNLGSQSDEEARNALKLLTDGVADAVRDWAHGGLMQGVQVSEDYVNGISAFAHRCKLAGSTALQ